MKFAITLCSILFLGLMSCQNSNYEVIIHGKIIGEDKIDLRISIPIGGVCYPGFYDSIQPDSLGNFKVVLTSIEQPVFVWLGIWGKSSYFIVVEPNNSYKIEINLNKEKPIAIKGENAVEQSIVNSYNYRTPNAARTIAEYGNEILSIEDVFERINADKERELNPLKELLKNGDITHDFFEIVKADRDCYYDIIRETVIRKRYRQAVKSNDSTLIDETELHMLEAFKEEKIENGEYLGTIYFNTLLEHYIDFKTQQRYNFVESQFAEGITQLYGAEISYHEYLVSESYKLLKGNVLEYFIATYLYSAAFQKKFEKDLISLFEDFNSKFPDSRYSNSIEPLIASIVEYQNTIEGEYSENVKFVKNYEQMDYLNEAIKSFKGKALYIDVWATWCGPCKEEFEHKAKLLELLESKGYEILYISIDDDKRNKQWQEMIKFYNLEGSHIRANEKLSKDLHSIYDNKEGAILIPWYMIIDKNGDILKLHAHRPSELVELEKELNEN